MYLGNGCFIAGTLVTTSSGLKPIEEIVIGDYVLSRNEETGEDSYKKVTDTLARSTQEICTIELETGKIKSTTGHLFMVKDKWWKAVVELMVGDVLETVDGQCQVVKSIIVEEKGYPVTTYNLTVEDNHTFFVNDAGILTHNMNNVLKGCNFAKGVIDETAENTINGISKDIADIITENGLTVNKFNELRVKDTSLLTETEKLSRKSIRDSIAMPDNTTKMQKVIPNSDINKYLDGSYTQVGGYITKYDDVSTLTKYDDIYESLRLDYPGTAYKVDSDSCLAVIRFKTPDAEKIEIPYGVDFGGTITDAPPFTGNGFTKAMNDKVIPEYKCRGYLNVDDGAELYELDKHGKEFLRAIYDADLKRFISVD